MAIKFDIKDLNLASEGVRRMDWAAREMPVLNLIGDNFKKEKPLKGLKVAACLHVTTETANLALALKAGGAEMVLCASNPLSTQDDVAAALVKDYGIPVFAIKGEDKDTYYGHIKSALSCEPQITMDDGADLVSALHTTHRSLLPNIIGGTEETTTGVIRLKSLHEAKKLAYPIIAVNEADTKHLFDNRYGTGQSTIDGIIRSTNILLAGKKVVICGYGWCGRGVAMRARGMGAQVIVLEVDPIKALEAHMEGYQVMSSSEAAANGDIFITLTGNISVLDVRHFRRMKDGVILANSGHFNVEINIPALEKMAKSRRMVRQFVEEFCMEDGRRIYLLGEGRLINLAAAEGHPASVMDMSFANQALSLKYLAENRGRIGIGVHTVPEKVDKQVGKLKLKSLGINIDKLTKEQKAYLSGWEMGT